MIINLCGNSGGGAPPVLDSLYVEQNGVYIPSEGVDGYSEVTVNVPSGTTNYSYKTPTADVNGLKAIGWNDESIGYFRDNNLCYDWQKDDYIVTEGNKELYGVVTKDNISTYKSDPNFVYCPMIDTSNVTNMSRMFDGCSSLTTIPLIDTSNVTSMYYAFNGCRSLTTIPLIDTSNVTSMYYTFYGCRSLTTIPLLDCGNVTTMYYTFYGCRSLTTIPLIDTSNVTSMYYTFYDCSSLQAIPELNTSNVTDMGGMFDRCSSLTTIPQFDTAKVTNMNYIFNYCSSLQSIPLLNCGKVTNMSTIFGYIAIDTLTNIGGFKDLKISVTSSFLDKAPNLTTDSLMNVINNVYDLTTNGLSGQSLKFGQTNLDKLTAEQIAVATAKGWTLTA